MLYTRKGDDGTSGLFGTKDRLPKNSPIYDALGALDELNSLLGMCRARLVSYSLFQLQNSVERSQESLFIIQAELAGAEKALPQEHVDILENAVDSIEKLIENPHAFIIPGATELSGLLDYARAVSRRAERVVISVSTTHTISPASIAYLNRLSSFLYALARYAAAEAKAKESSPSY
ncbi:MAG: cob(I)yrinic acid a,c-diamide adenosyltransferase [Candidatus Pacebacteria bacterium]|nr:cob(I)yrinic acid a,c-diamide adenosyltransferase [Candidatus Paceibacterota bacterium]MBP9832605.1 cob(I)yrinic acid a,c-diamide adenosyltransferase [Candidatus Paceibacterota bacterium]